MPYNLRSVLDVYNHGFENHDALVEMLRDIYREHGWPDMERQSVRRL